jgi:hypothetical protein
MAKLNLREELIQEATKQEEKLAPVQMERWELVDKELKFTVSYDAPDGNCYVTDLVSIAPDAECRMIKARAFSRLLNGLSVTQLSRDEQLRLEALARVISQVKQLPEWVEQWISCDNELLAYINSVVSEHETRYFRGNSVKGEAAQGQPRVRIDSPFTKAATPA